MPILGAHMSVAGGFHRAVERGVEAECDCIQIFTKNNNQWKAPPIDEAASVAFREAMTQSPLRHVLSHASYLINLASPKKDLWKKSLEAMRVELQRAEQLEIRDVVVHPGAATDGDEQAGLARIVDAINEIHALDPEGRSRILLETTAGQGSCLGWSFEHLAEILDGIVEAQRVGVCLDTCHVFAAGYGLAPRKTYEKTMEAFDSLIGLGRLDAIHLNDSKREFGSRVDRHEHIGDGHLGLTAFRLLLNDPRMQFIPMYLETAKEDSPDGRSWDVVNLERLRNLVRKS